MSAIVKRKKIDKSLTADEVTYFKNAVLLTLLTWQEMYIFFPSSVQPTQWSSDLNDQKWVWRKNVCFLLCMWTDTWMRWRFFLLLQLWWHRTGDPELWNSATWAAVPEGTTAGLQLCEFTLKHPPTWIKHSVWFCLPRHTDFKLIYIKSPEASYILHPISLVFFLDVLFFLFAVNSWALVIPVLILISQTAHLLVLLAKQPVEIVAIFRTNVRWHGTDYRVNHPLIKEDYLCMWCCCCWFFTCTSGLIFSVLIADIFSAGPGGQQPMWWGCVAEGSWSVW